MSVSCFLCVFLTCIAVSHGNHSNIDFKFKNGSVLTKSTNDIDISSTFSSTEFFEKEKKIIAHKNEMTKECVLKQMNDQGNISNFKNNYEQNMELTEDEMVEIIGENLKNFCKDKIIILNNFDNERSSRSKRSTDKKRYQGQTQTQFVSFGSKNSNQETKNGLAEALSQPDLSRATVSGLNGMGQAQSQSSFNECDDCSGQDYRTHSTHVDNSQPKHFQSLRPNSPQNQNARPYSESNTNRQSLGSQNEDIQKGHSINDQYPNTYPGSGTSNTFPNNQVHGHGVKPFVGGQYPASGVYNKLSGNQDQGYGTTPSIDGQYLGLGANDKLPGYQVHRYGIRPFVDGQYQESGTNNKLPGNQNQGYSISPSIIGQYSGSGINDKLPDAQNQKSPSKNMQYPGSGTNNKIPSNQDQGYGISLSVVGQYPGSETNNKLSGNSDHGYGNVPFIYGQYPDKNQGSGSNNNTELGKINSEHVYNSANEQNRNLPNTNSAESKKIVNNDVVNPNTYSIYSSPFNPSRWDYQKKITNNNPNVDQQIYTDESGFPNIPSGSDHGILTPHYTPNSEWTHPSYNPQVPVTTLIEHQNKLSNYPSSLLPNYQQTIPNVLGQLTPNKHISKDTNSQNDHNIKNGVAGIQNVYPLSSNIYGGQDYTQLNLPSLCNFLYQTCLNALSNNKRMNEFQITSSQINERNPNEKKQVSFIQVPTIQRQGYHSYGGRNQNRIQPSFGQPQGILDSRSPDFQQPGYVPSGGNVNQIHPNYGQPQGTLGSVGTGFQQPRYVQSGGNVNQMQPNYGQPQGTLGSVFQQPGYLSSVGNVNQIQPSYGQSQGTLDSDGFGFQQPGYVQLGGNVNQMQPNYGQPQGTFGSGGSGAQQPGYVPSGGNVNQVQPNYGQPQGTLDSDGFGFQQPGYVQSGGNLNQMQPTYGQSQGTLGSGGSVAQQPGYVPSDGNVNQVQPTYGQSQGTLGSGGSGAQQPGYVPSGGNVNQVQPTYGQSRGSLDSGEFDFQQPSYVQSGGNVNQMQPNYGQPQGTFGSGGSGAQQPGYVPSGGNLNKGKPTYGQPQGTFGSGESSAQQPGYVPSGGNLNQMQPNYGQSQGTFGSGGYGAHQPGYVPSGGNVNQVQPTYGQPQDTLGSGGSGAQQPGYNLSHREPNQSGVSSVQSPLGGKKEPQSYSESYGDNNFSGPSLKPGSEMGNINPLTNPIIGGQFGTDISSGGSVTLIDTERGDAQSMTNVDVDGQETRASASAQGKSKTGISQTQVSGSYLGTGTFSAQAQTSDSDKGAQSQIVSNTNGTTSTAQGKGGRGQAQSQVLYNADNGIALGEAQSSGINYGTNTQLQAGIKGGVADAQSTGPGSTSSQAQIGFLPHEFNNSTNQKSLFKGSGTTSAQAGSYSGQSQSQLFGSYKHGISYNGAAQASTGKKLQNLPKLNLADAKLKIERLEGSLDPSLLNEVKNETNVLQNLQNTPNLLRSQNQTEISNVNNHKQQIISSTQTPSILQEESSRNIDVYPEYEDNDEYDEDSDEIVNTKSAQTNKETIPKQEQNIILKLDDKHDAKITHDSDSQLKSGQVLDAGQVIPGTNGTKIPNGFRGRVASVAGDQTEAKAIPGGQAQTQTVFLTPGVGSLTVVDKTKLRAQLNKESYVSPTNRFQSEISGGIAKLKPDKKNVQYFTKSSTCGYFSFSCNYVDGRKDGAKICKPNPPPSPCQKSYN
ncbi:PREDICTED: uncharacterized protein LOC107163104 [Diuraphis noxia]|uniref:uncharacterized protein LOC107163104 n=1 Tax=Diuraphis noxia TaxID=143948 RepID=UPI000763645F|nr:PREDICTED: uncharacterized protein LOC107163104 [Diuraphis noxia]